MSFILDALKKSETDRQRQNGPALFEVKVAPPRSGLPLWAIGLGVLLAVNLIIVAWVLLRRPAQAETGASQGGQSLQASSDSRGGSGGQPGQGNGQGSGAGGPGGQGSWQGSSGAAGSGGQGSWQGASGGAGQGQGTWQGSSGGAGQGGQGGWQGSAGAGGQAGQGGWQGSGAAGPGQGQGGSGWQGSSAGAGQGGAGGAWQGAPGGTGQGGQNWQGGPGGQPGQGQAWQGGQQGQPGWGGQPSGQGGGYATVNGSAPTGPLGQPAGPTAPGSFNGAGETGGDKLSADDYAPAADAPAAAPFGNHVTHSTASGVPLYQDAALKTRIPELRLDLHVFAAQPQDRFVMINMHKLHEGDTLPEGVRVESITPEGAVLSKDGSRFLLPRQ